MTHWRAAAGADDVQHDDDLGYYGGWTLSGIAVLATIGAVWLLGV